MTGSGRRPTTDQFQLTSIIAAAIRGCHESTTQPAVAQPSPEETNCIAKAVLSALADAGLTIVQTETD